MDIFHSYNHIQKQIILTADLKQKIEYEFVFGWSVHQNSLVERVDGGGSFIFPAIIFKMAHCNKLFGGRIGIVFGGRTVRSYDCTMTMNSDER